MSFRVLTMRDRKFFTTVYRLAQQSLEGFYVWTVLLNPLRVGVIGRQSVVASNEDLLRIIITNAKRAFVITTYILCDDRGSGAAGHNVYKLLDRAANIAPSFDKVSNEELLQTPEARAAIKKLRILRNNLDAHHSVSDEWKESIGKIENSDLEHLILTIYNIVYQCNAAVGLEHLSAKALTTRTTTYGDRLLRALAQQIEDKLVGTECVSVEDWESGARYDSPEESEEWNKKRK